MKMDILIDKSRYHLLYFSYLMDLVYLYHYFQYKLLKFGVFLRGIIALFNFRFLYH